MELPKSYNRTSKESNPNKDAEIIADALVNEIENHDEKLQDLMYDLFDFCRRNGLIDELNRLEEFMAEKEISKRATDDLWDSRVSSGHYKIELKPVEVEDLLHDPVADKARELMD